MKALDQKFVTTLALAAFLAALPVYAQTWVPTAGGSYNWNSSSNWSAAFPNAADAVASVNLDLTGDQIINLNQAITVGSLTLNDSGATADSAITVATGTVGGQLIFQTSSGSATLAQNNGGTTTISSAVAFNSNTAITGGSITLSGPLSGSGTITKNNAANGITLTGDNSAFTGAWVLSGNATNSRLFVAADNNLGAANVGITFTNINQISFTAAGTTLAATRTFTLNSGATAVFTAAAGIGNTVNSKITGAGAVTSFGGGSTTLFLGNSANDFTGQLNLTGGGIVSINSLADAGVASSVGAGSIINYGNNSGGGGSLVYTGSAASSDRALQVANTTSTTTARLINNGTGALTMTSTANLLTATDPVANVLVTNFFLGGTNAGANTFAQNINASVGTGAVNFTKQDAGTWRLTNSANTYAGVTTIAASGGVLEVVKLANGGVNSSIGASTNAAINLLIGNAGSLRYVGAGDSTDRQFTVNGTAAGHNATLDASGTGAVNFTNAGAVAFGTTNQTRTLILRGTNTGTNTLAAAITNNGTAATSVTKSDSGKWVLTGANTYTGATTITDGTLALGANNALGAGSAITLTAGTLDLQAFSTTAASLNFAAGSSLKFNLSTPGNVTALLALAGSFDKNGTGTFTIDLAGTGQVGTYNLVSFSGTTFGGANDFTIANLGSGLSGALALNGSALSLIVTTSAVPEPSTYALLAGGLALAGAVWRSRKQKRNA